MFVPIGQVVIDDLYYPRNQVSWRHVLRYTQALESGVTLPPIVVGKELTHIEGKRRLRLVLLDGRHRVEAHAAVNHKKIGVIITKAEKKLWFAEAVRLNCQHGVPLSYQERLMAAMRLSRDGFKVEDVERIVLISNETLQKSLKERVAFFFNPEDVKPIVLKAPLTGVVRLRGESWVKQHGRELDQQQSRMASEDAHHTLDQALALLEGDLLDPGKETFVLVKRLQEASTHWLQVHE